MPDIDYWMPGEDRAAIEAETERDMLELRSKGPGTIERLFDDEDPYGGHEDQDPEQVEKGAFPVLFGWSINGDLAFQDGIPGVFGADHCSAFGLSCDNAWHIQAQDLSISSSADFLDANSLRGRCGSFIYKADSTNNSWYPCVLPHIHPGSRTRRWWFDAASCPNEATRRDHMRAAIISMSGWVDILADINWIEAASSASSHVIFRCSTGLPAGTAMRFRPNGALTLRYATASTYEIGAFTESCETPGYPGSNPVASYTQAPDMMYTYSQAVIEINWEPTFQFIAGCTTNASYTRMSLGNIVAHEVGHYFTLAHNQVNNGYTDVMRSGQTCAQTIVNSKGYTLEESNGIYHLDTSTTSPALTIYDEDISCLKPENQ